MNTPLTLMHVVLDVTALTAGGTLFGWIASKLLLGPSVARRSTQPTPDGQADGGES